jgi:hypothetical protein
MLTARTLIKSAGLTALATALSEIAGRPCSPQNIVYWRRMDAVPGKWLQAVLTYLRRRGDEPTADDVASLSGGPSVEIKHICKKPRRQATNNGKSTRLCEKPQLDGAAR